MFHAKAKVVQEVPKQETNDVLKELCGSDEAMRSALSNFLLVDPRLQSQQIGSMDKLSEEANKALATGNKLRARISFEIAVRLALHYQDQVALERNLKLADRVTEEEGRREMHQTLLLNPEKALSIANQYYKRVYPEAQTKKEIVVTAPISASR